jgi:hypothetical protein
VYNTFLNNRGVVMASKQSIFVGDRFQMKSGLWLEAVEYLDGKHIKVRFDISGYELLAEGVQIRRGTIRDWIANGINTGDRYLTKSCGWLEVVKYHSASKIDVKFEVTGFRTTVEACQLKRSNIWDKLLPSVLGVGCLGDGPYATSLPNGKATWLYTRWSGMLERCYDIDFKLKSPHYSKCTSSTDWLNFQNFADWASKQDGYMMARWQLDKDIISKGNKLYSAETCCFVPQEINTLLIKAEKARGDCPIGLSWHTNNKYCVHVGGVGKSGYVGIYDDLAFAFDRYKTVKEAFIKKQAAKWQSQIDPRAYEALMSYEVLITD